MGYKDHLPGNAVDGAAPLAGRITIRVQEAARQAFEKEGLALNFVSGSWCLGGLSGVQGRVGGLGADSGGVMGTWGPHPS